MQSSGGVASAGTGGEEADHHRAVGPGGRRARQCRRRRDRGLSRSRDARRRRHSTDLCLIEGGRPHVTNGGAVGAFPVRIPMIDIKTIGTGGGSIAWISREGHLKVGPKSAGAEPGRCATRKAAAEPTITDANLVLGRIPAALIGGGIALDVARSRAGHCCAWRSGFPANMSVEQLAEGIIEIANWNQANAIRQMTIQRGIDPRGFALLAFGGAGPAQSPAVMELLGMQACIVPPDPGNLSAFGLLAVDWRTDHIVTRVMHQDAIDLAAVAGLYAELEADAVGALARDGIERDRMRIMREADVRYSGQSMEVRVTAPSGPIDKDFLDVLIAAFHAAHLRTFGYNYSGEQKVELVNFCVSGFGMIERPQIPELPARAESILHANRSRPVYFDGAFQDTPVYDRASLGPRVRLEGPAVIEEFGSTTVRLSAPGACSRSAWRPGDLPSAGERRGQIMTQQTAAARSASIESTSSSSRVDPIVLQIVEGTLGSIEAEIEYAIERTARSPMIREAHDYRVGLFDRHCRKLTGRSYSAMPECSRARLPAGNHATRRRVSHERHLSQRRQHRTPARSLQHGTGVSSRRSRRIHPGFWSS